MGNPFGNAKTIPVQNILHLDHAVCNKLDPRGSQSKDGKCHMYWDFNFKFKIPANVLLAMQDDWFPPHSEMLRCMGERKVTLVRQDTDLTAPGYFRIYDDENQPITFERARAMNLAASEEGCIRIPNRGSIYAD